MSDTVAIPYTDGTKDLVNRSMNIWLIQQPDFKKDFLITGLELIDNSWHIVIKGAKELIESNVDNLLSRMQEELTIRIIY